jgi:hypothetical protein
MEYRLDTLQSRIDRLASFDAGVVRFAAYFPMSSANSILITGELAPLNRPYNVAQGKLPELIASAVGYANATALTRGFSQRVGVSPSE